MSIVRSVTATRARQDEANGKSRTLREASPGSPYPFSRFVAEVGCWRDLPAWIAARHLRPEEVELGQST
jgi:hypothetical protein